MQTPVTTVSALSFALSTIWFATQVQAAEWKHLPGAPASAMSEFGATRLKPVLQSAAAGWLEQKILDAAGKSASGNRLKLAANSDAAGQTAEPAPGSFSALPALLARARRLLDQNQPDAAYQLLEPQTWDYAGARDFDYLLGIAALDSKRPGEAVIALERVLDNHPDDVAARTEIVRAYLALDERPGAEQALRQLMSTAELPPEATESIRRYLDILARGNTRQQRHWQLGLDLTAGFDTNVNVGSSQNRWLLDDGIALQPLPANQPQRSPFAEVLGNIQYSQPLTPSLEWSSSLMLSQRLNTRQHSHDLGSIGLSSGLAFSLERHRFSTAVNVQQMLLDQHRFRHAAGLILQWQFQRDAQNQLGLYAQHFALRFRGQHIRDATRTVFGATAAHVFKGNSGSVLLFNPYAGAERPRHHQPTLDFRIHGLRLGYQRNLSDNWRASLGLQWEKRRHTGTDPLFGRTRRDRQFDLRLSADYTLDARWTLTPALQYTRNHATLAPNDFRRTQLQVSVGYRY
ncbi:MAG: porin family protein [Lautropia sp.]|nr:porin family protein [Lautropia sp.]